jgi:hypothetical protein
MTQWQGKRRTIGTFIEAGGLAENLSGKASSSLERRQADYKAVLSVCERRTLEGIPLEDASQ